MKTVLVTGSSSGLGKSIIEKFASMGYNTIITYNTKFEKAKIFNSYIKEKYKVNSEFYKLDITDEENINSLVTTLKSKQINIDVLVNNAGIAIDNLYTDKTKEEFLKIVTTNLVGTFLVTKAFGSLMYESKNGVIINVSSNNSIDSYYSESIDYDASKAGINNMTHNFANILSPYIRVNTVCPGWINTPMNTGMSDSFKEKETEKILLKRFASPIEIANLVYFLASDEASYINDAIIKIDGGKKC